MGIKLSDKGDTIVRRGGADGMSADDMLLLEIAKRAPGLSPEDLKIVFVSLMVEYGEDALDAVRSGHVEFQLRAPRDMPDTAS